jgi:hypothetical protein
MPLFEISEQEHRQKILLINDQRQWDRRRDVGDIWESGLTETQQTQTTRSHEVELGTVAHKCKHNTILTKHDNKFIETQ